ncbi:MAG: serine/threonine protein kinase [Cyanobacteria bacterium SZAS LIN-3]|nr:serine/threonine protein kinase [Cyanobacteria bacterium SZAS LIN-3]MBS2006867.1 serine/threonine protein kinase [Cyanobacteria bacterium SZAS TMP-1]
MQAPKRRKYFIDLNGPAARANLKVMAILYPLWGLYLPYFIVFPRGSSFEGPDTFAGWTLWLTIVYLGILTFALSILTNRLLITSKSIRFGHKLFSAHSTAKLKALTLERSPITNEESVVRFRFDETGKESETIETAGMESRMKARLLAAVDNLGNHCQVPRAVRTAVAANARPLLRKYGDSVTLDYHSRLLLYQIKESINIYQHYFWRVWTGVFAFLTIGFGPIILWMGYVKIKTHFFYNSLIYQETNVFFDHWSRLFRVFDPLLNQTGKTANEITNVSSAPHIAISLTVLAVLALLAFGAYLCRPNRLKISPEGMVLQTVYFDAPWRSTTIPWATLAAIDLEKAGYSSPTNWKIIFRSKVAGEKQSLTLGALGNSAQKLELVKAIEKYAAEIPVDPDVLTALAPPSDNSYTELWLASLASAPQREKLTPLGSGHNLKDGAYIVEDKHGAGGQGVTYLARRQRIAAGEESADLVIKETILPVYVDSDNRRKSVENFERDARLLTKLEHPALVKLLDYFIEDHRAYLVLERIHGQNLRQLVEDSGPLAPSVVLGLAEQMCDILSYLHNQTPEVIHRDFTPENLILDLSDRLKLIDFGVAHEFKSRTTATVVGKHAYLPPEQLRGKPTTQSDLYALAATLHYLLTGEDPVPLTRLNPFEQVCASRTLDESEKQCLATLSKAIENASELDTAARVVDAVSLRQLLTAQSEHEQGVVLKFNVKDMETVDG